MFWVTSFLEFLRQVWVLSIKQFHLSRRGWVWTLGQFVPPILAMLLLLVFQILPQGDFGRNNTTGNVVELLPKCQGLNKHDTKCYSLLYAPTTNPAANRIAELIGKQNNLKVSRSLADHQGIVGFETEDELTRWFRDVKKNANRTLGGFIANWGRKLDNGPGDMLNITVMYNGSCPSGNVFVFCKDWRYVLTKAVGQAVLSYSSENNTDVRLDLRHSTYPVLSASRNAVTMYGGLMIFLGGVFFYLLLLYNIIHEKETNIRQGMRTMGLKGTSYWMVWFLYYVGVLVISIVLMYATAWVCQLSIGHFNFFTDTNPVVFFLALFSYGLALLTMHFWFTTMIPTVTLALYLGVLQVLIGLVLMFVFGSFGFLLFPSLYTLTGWSRLYRYFLPLLPYYNFAYTLFTISTRSYSNNGSTGPGFGFMNLFDRIEFMSVKAPAPYVPILINFGLAFLFMVLSWLCDNILSNGGASLPVYFFLTPSYWRLTRPPAKKGKMQMDRALVDSGVLEAADVAEGASDDFEGMRVLHLHKRYYKAIRRWMYFTSVEDFTVAVPHGTLFCLLGSNGAGKSTTIGMLTGVFPPVRGDAEIYGNSIVGSMDLVRRMMGVCPQHDILWDNMTAREHLYFFAGLKQVKRSEKKAMIDHALESVKLTAVANKLVGTYSGGMKRRLSVAISAIGDPKIIFMDEPTTGMDPMSKRHVWDYIQELKKDRIIVLTTHSMEEADVLCDTMAIMAHGRLRCYGTPLHLKHKFGSGFRLNVMAVEGQEEAAMALVASQLPMATLVASTSNYMIYGVPSDVPQEVVIGFFALVEHQEGEKVIQDVSISHTTLEEVFLNVTANAQAERE